LLQRAEEAFGAGNPGRAVEFYEEILKKDRDHVLAWLNLGNVLRSLERLDDAEIAYRRTLEINPYYIFGNIALAQLYLTAKQPERAVEVLESVLEWHPGDSEVRLYMGLAFAFKNDLGRAIREFENALQLDPDYDLPHYFLGVQYRKSRPALARKHLNQFLDLSAAKPEHKSKVAKAEQLLRQL
jgi:spermidine synthase